MKLLILEVLLPVANRNTGALLPCKLGPRERATFDTERRCLQAEASPKVLYLDGVGDIYMFRSSGESMDRALLRSYCRTKEDVYSRRKGFDSALLHSVARGLLSVSLWT
jgi:hypothetical protein